MAANAKYFRAVLKSEDDQFLADGYACVSSKEKYVEFKSQFVPILLFGSKAHIIRIVDSQEAHCFEGTVYLSSPTLLRIVNVSDNLLEECDVGLESPQPVSFKANVNPIISHRGMFQFAAERLLKFRADIYSISLAQVRFTSQADFIVGEQLQLSADDPVVLKRVVVEVTQTLLFGEDKTGYRCEIIELPEPSRTHLSNYLSRGM